MFKRIRKVDRIVRSRTELTGMDNLGWLGHYGALWVGQLSSLQSRPRTLSVREINKCEPKPGKIPWERGWGLIVNW